MHCNRFRGFQKVHSVCHSKIAYMPKLKFYLGISRSYYFASEGIFKLWLKPLFSVIGCCENSNKTPSRCE